MPHLFTPEQAAFIKEYAHSRSNAELTGLVNSHFGLCLDVRQIKAFKKNHKISSGLDGRFPPGHAPANKGAKGVGGWKPTQFKKGHTPSNYRPVGSDRINVDGYIEIKVADPRKWKGKHVVVWEEQNGPVPKGYVVIFGDGNNRNFDLNNLLLVSRKQLATLNKKGLIQNDADLTRTGIIMADLYHKISERKKVK
jgi:hypothetical protein